MSGDSSIPATGIPRSLSGSATRPVPTANSRAAPFGERGGTSTAASDGRLDMSTLVAS